MYILAVCCGVIRAYVRKVVILIAIVMALQFQSLDIVYSGSACAAFRNDTTCFGVNSASMHRLALVKRLSIIGIELICYASCIAGIDKRFLLSFRIESSLSCGPST